MSGATLGMEHVGIPKAPHLYARELAGYIRCPSTIRVRTLEMYGRAPTLETIAQMRRRIEAKAQQERDKIAALDRSDALRVERERKRQAAKVARRKAEPAPVEIPIGRLPGFEVVEIVAKMFGTTPELLTGPTRDQHMVHGRAIVCAVLNDRGLSLSQIARFMGRNDHSTVKHALAKLPTYLKHIPGMADCLARAMKANGK